MAIPTGVIFIWSGTNATIPAGWVRETSLDGKFPKGNLDANTNPNITGGASTHSHNATANHSHTMNNHTHAFTIGNHPINALASGGGQTYAAPSHNHGGSSTTGNSSGGELSSVSATYSAISNNPPYYDVIFIKPSATVGGLADQVIGLTDDTSYTDNTGKYNGYYKCDGNNSTPNLSNKYLKGASTGADAGTTGGSTTNIHNLVHTHVVSAHTHASVNTGGSVNITASTSTSSDKLKDHGHTVSFGNATVTVNNDPSITTSETVEPEYVKLLPIQNRSGGVYTPTGIIGMWLGTVSSVPGNFELVSSMYNKHLKLTTTAGDIGNTGGSNTHTHTGNTHTHTGSSHTHSISGLDHNAVGRGGSTGSNDASARPSESHPSSMTAGTTSYSTATTDSDSASNEPEYRTVAFIKYKGGAGGAFLFNLIR
jgi:hypothetical protein